jgi:hypothetical protein
MPDIWAMRRPRVKGAAKMPLYLRKAQAAAAMVPFSLTF